MFTIKNLEACFNNAMISDSKYVGVIIETRGTASGEVIINPNVNFKSKLDYYRKAYTEDLVLKSFDGIKIVAFTYGDSFEEIQSDLFNSAMFRS